MAVVVVLHGLVLAAVRFARVEPSHHEEQVTLVAILRDPAPVRDEQPMAPPPVRLIAPTPAVIVDATTAIRIPFTEDPPATGPVVPVATAPSGTAPVQALGTALEVQCPDRTPPRYPPLAKRQREQGEVRLRVELDESGRVDRVTIVSSSGSPRLDAAARTAIESWRCRPAEHDGQPVRAVALQSLAFVLERH